MATISSNNRIASLVILVACIPAAPVFEEDEGAVADWPQSGQ